MRQIIKINNLKNRLRSVRKIKKRDCLWKRKKNILKKELSL